MDCCLFDLHSNNGFSEWSNYQFISYFFLFHLLVLVGLGVFPGHSNRKSLNGSNGSVYNSCARSAPTECTRLNWKWYAFACVRFESLLYIRERIYLTLMLVQTRVRPPRASIDNHTHTLIHSFIHSMIRGWLGAARELSFYDSLGGHMVG